MKAGDIVLDKESMTKAFVVIQTSRLSDTKLPCVYASVPKLTQVEAAKIKQLVAKGKTPPDVKKLPKVLRNYAHRESMLKSNKYGDLNIVQVRQIIPFHAGKDGYLKWHDELLTPSLGPDLFEMMYDLGKGAIYKTAADTARAAEAVVDLVGP